MVNIEWVGRHTLTELVLLCLAFVLCAIIGLERHRKLKSAGLRTHTLVGVGAAVFTLVSAYGFSSVDVPGSIVDPSRIAAQVVSGVGFLGAGVIFVRQNTVAGLTTAASIWVAASVGMACGAGSPFLAIAATALHLLAVWALGWLGHRVQRPPTDAVVKVRYRGGFGALAHVVTLAAASPVGAFVTDASDITTPGKAARFLASLSLTDARDPGVTDLLNAISDTPGVLSVKIVAADDDHAADPPRRHRL